VHTPTTANQSPLAPPLTTSSLLTAQVVQRKQLFFSLFIAFILQLIQNMPLCSFHSTYVQPSTL